MSISSRTRLEFTLTVYRSRQFIKKDLHSKYKTVADAGLKQINRIHDNIIDKLRLLYKIEPYDQRIPQFTLKDQKENFEIKPTNLLLIKLSPK